LIDFTVVISFHSINSEKKTPTFEVKY